MASLLRKLFGSEDHREAHDKALSEARESHRIDKTKAFEFIERLGNIPIHRFNDYGSYLKAGTNRVWASFRACHITANVLVKTNFVVRDRDGKPLLKIDNNLVKLLTNPNPHDTWEDMVYVWTHHMKLTGNAYWVKDEMDGRGRPLNIYPLMPQFVEVVPHARDKIAGYLYKVNGRVIQFSPSEIVHFRRPHPNNLVMGIGDVEPAEALFNDQINRDTYNETFMANGASPSGILTRQDDVEVSQDDWTKFKAWWDATYSGKSNAGRTAFLQGKWNYMQLGLTASQMQTLERDKLSIQMIFTAHGVPLSVAGIEKATSLATARQDDINFRKYECVPLIDQLVAKINGPGGIIPAFGEGIRLDYDLAGLVDVEQVMKDYMPLVEVGGMTINELREMAGLQKTKDPLHDAFYIKQGLIPLEMAGIADPAPADLEKVVFGLTHSDRR